MAISKTVKLDNSGGVDIAPDSYIGLLVRVVHLGVQKNTYEGTTTLKDQILLQFELQDVLMDSGNPITVSSIVTNSLKNKAKFLKIAKAFGVDVTEGVDLEELIGKPIMVVMDHNTAKTKVVVKDFTKVPSSLLKTVKPLSGTPTVLLDVEEITEAQKSELSEWVRNIINNRIREGGSSSEHSSGAVDL